MYTDSIYSPHRRKTRTVKIGDLAIGSTHPILVQSMTTTPTTDTDATVAQILSLVKVGCPLVRITVPRQADADNLKNIKKVLLQKNISVPLVADIHFLPKLALQACDYVDKVRINPGNFADRKKFEIKEYSDKEYQTELSRVADEFLPIVRRAKENGIAMRIGTNHGSLSDRIMNRFGDTPKGMVESALEFIRIAREENFHDLVLSMKASNPFVMITAYRLLAQELGELSWDYPLHLGVTEAGDGQDGRIKSSIGISTLLFDGLGDTVRVSLTEDPEKEIPVAHSIVSLFSKAPLDELKKDIVQDLVGPTIGWDPYTYKRRSSQTLLLGNVTTGADHPITVHTFGPRILPEMDPPVEVISVSGKDTNLPHQTKTFVIARLKNNTFVEADGYSVSVNETWKNYLESLLQKLQNKVLYLRVEKVDQIPSLMDMIAKLQGKVPLGVEISGMQIITLGRAVASALFIHQHDLPIHLHVKTSVEENQEEMILRTSGELGALLSDGIGDSIEVEHQNPQTSHMQSFAVLQATRLRMSRTDYISCPSCGRTLFDLQETTARIRSKTNHLKGVKIAIMGCIVNGPGEMADADFGYVGSGPGKINLFVGKDCVEKNIDQSIADERLVDLIKQHGRWLEPQNT